MKIKVLVLLLGFQMLYAVESPWMVYTEPAANKQCRIVIHDLAADSMIMDYYVPLKWGFSEYYFFSKTSIIGESGNKYYHVELKNKTITQLKDWDYKTVVFNQGVWAKVKGDTIVIGTPEETSNIFFNVEPENQYKQIEKLEWICKRGDKVYLCLLVLNSDYKQQRKLMVKDNDEIVFQNIVDTDHSLVRRYSFRKTEKSPNSNFIGAIYYNEDEHIDLLYFLDLRNYEYLPIAKNVMDFTWLNNDTLVLCCRDSKFSNLQIDLLDLKNQNKTELFEYDHIGYSQSLFVHDDDFYFKHFSRHLEIITKIRFMKYDFKTGEISEVLKFNRSRDSFYSSYVWDIMYVDDKE